MNQTVAYYNANAKEFCSTTVDADMSECRNRFTAYLPIGARILDAGCGSGRDSKAFMEQGYLVTAMDASPAICLEAENLLHQPVLCMGFEELSFENKFDGIWACASLLHVSREDMSDALARLKRALKSSGILYASFKYGRGERLSNGRLFYELDEESAQMLFVDAGFDICELFTTEDVMEDRLGEKWINVIAKNRT